MFNFKNSFVQQLPADPITDNYPRQVDHACYSLVEPTKTNNPEVICISQDFASSLKLSSNDLDSEWFKNIVSGNDVTKQMQPYAMCYGGHQFGHWAGQLGDGRAINLGEVIDAQGHNQTLQLKGAGLTPYSRTADGLAVLRSSVREFLCSEAMFYLGIPTTRALSLSLTGDKVMRDMFYDGNADYELGAVVCRVSPSFLRFGSFQIHASKHQHETLIQLINYSINTNFSHLGDPRQTNKAAEIYEKWFEEICQSTMSMIIHWMRVGFVHGVMNTDNMSILGQTIDYGPYGWLEGYEQNWTPNTTDAQGKRYSYGSQPQVAHWNLFQLAQAIAPMIKRVESLEKSLADFTENYTQLSAQMYADKLGLEKHNGKHDQQLVEDLLIVLQLTETDMTIFFRQLSKIEKNFNHDDKVLLQIIMPAFYFPKEIKNELSEKYLIWLKQYIKRISHQKWNDTERSEKMNQTNPKYILRNYLVQVAIDKANDGDYSEIDKLLNIMKKPYNEQPEFEAYANKRPDWARNKAGCSMLSCSS